MGRRGSMLVALGVLLLSPLLTACSPGWRATADDLSSQPMSLVGNSARGGRLAFVPNAGQLDPSALFHSLGSGNTLFFARNQVVLTFARSDRAARSPVRVPGLGPIDLGDDEPLISLRLTFEGAAADSRIVGQEKLPGVVNYFVGQDATNWRRNVPTYRSIVYEKLFSDIDLVFDGSPGSLKGTYRVAPGADPSDIRWRYSGATSVRLDKDSGQLLIGVFQSGEATLVERRPVAWQTIDGERRTVSVRYRLNRDGSIGFRVAKYDRTRPLIIDPTHEYGT